MTAASKLPVNDDDNKKPEKQSWDWTKRYSRLLLKLFAIMLTIYVCFLSWERYFKFWVQTTIERTDVHISEIPFPAITICPTHLTLDSLNNTNTKQRELSRMNRLYNLIQSIQLKPVLSEEEVATNFTEFEDYYNQSISEFGSTLYRGYQCRDLFKKCTWRRREVNCCTIFKTFGFGVSCYIFNSIFGKNADLTYPWSVAGSGVNSGLNVKMNRNVSVHHLESVLVMVQEPSEYLGTNLIYTKDDRIAVPLQPQRFTAEDDVRARPMEMRYCYFIEEMETNYRLRSECINSCHIKFMTEKCKCYINTIMAINKDNNANQEASIRPCTVRDLSCFTKYKISFFSMSNIIEESRDFVFNTTDCKCYPNCNHIKYHASTYTDHMGNAKNDDLIEVDIYFQEETLISYRSTLQIVLLDLIVSFGGIAGLILGYSLLGCINTMLDRIAFCAKSRSRSADPTASSHASSRLPETDLNNKFV
ncbi:sodium channel protein Nach [Drosophila nasuta]|uniref:sodium channel protein Nach n=1 Tax=Drosophila nasuta TaxID=42062 RepID=UPI00295EA11A|nr:sodium channel protein Nach [Drosophila nasuta]